MFKEHCSEIKKNPHKYITQDDTGKVELRLIKEDEDILIFKKTFDNSAGYVFLACKEYIDEDVFRDIYGKYIDFVKRECRGMFKEVELIIFTSEITPSVKETIQKYNEYYTGRKPIEYHLLSS